MAKQSKIRQLTAGYHGAVPVGDLKPHPRNPRRGDLPAIAESIVVNGFYGCVVVQCSTSYVLAGNHTLRAAVDCGATAVPVYALDVDDAQAVALMLADNKIADRAHYDDKELGLILDRCRKDLESLAGTGWTNAEADRLIAEAMGTDAAGEKPDDKDEDAGDDTDPTFRLVIRCKDEAAQKKLLRQLTKQGFNPRASVA